MLWRARRLKKDLHTYAQRFPEDKIPLFSNSDWQHVNYLIEILHPYDEFTRALGKVRNGPSIHRVYAVYNALFDHLEKYEQLLQRKRVGWKRQVHRAILAAHDKLKKYYSDTQGARGSIFGIATILNPTCKTTFFQTGSFLDETDENGISWVL